MLRIFSLLGYSSQQEKRMQDGALPAQGERDSLPSPPASHIDSSLVGTVWVTLRCLAALPGICWWAGLRLARQSLLSAGGGWRRGRLASTANLFTRSTMKKICSKGGSCRMAETDVEI